MGISEAERHATSEGVVRMLAASASVDRRTSMMKLAFEALTGVVVEDDGDITTASQYGFSCDCARRGLRWETPRLERYLSK